MDFLDSFIEDLRERDYVPHTILAYCRDVAAFFMA